MMTNRIMSTAWPTLVSATFAIGLLASVRSIQAEHINNEISNHINSAKASNLSVASTSNVTLEGRASDHWFVKDIVERLHALDADIGKLLYNSTSMYAPSEQDIPQKDGTGKFSEVLNDLDSLQDEVS